MSFGKVATDRKCRDCEKQSTWIHNNGIYLVYFCSNHIDTDAAGKQAKIDGLVNE